MISLKKYLDGSAQAEASEDVLLAVAVAAYRAALVEMGNSGLDACPALGVGLKEGLTRIEEKLKLPLEGKALETSEEEVREHLRGWGRETARHYQQKTDEVKEILLTMARTAEAVGERDHRCAEQLSSVTTRLKAIANLEDLSQIRSSIEASATELKSSIDRMAAEGKAAVESLRKELTSYQAKLEEAEQMAWRDGLTGVRSRLCAEGQLERAIKLEQGFCVAIVDIDDFKQVNDKHGHMVGDELLKQFAQELQSSCRSTDLIARWGGDEFLILFTGSMQEAESQVERVRKWVCGAYTLEGVSGQMKLEVNASIGLAEHKPGETVKELLERADGGMYQNKAENKKARR